MDEYETVQQIQDVHNSSRSIFFTNRELIFEYVNLLYSKYLLSIIELLY